MKRIFTARLVLHEWTDTNFSQDKCETFLLSFYMRTITVVFFLNNVRLCNFTTNSFHKLIQCIFSYRLRSRKMFRMNTSNLAKSCELLAVSYTTICELLFIQSYK